MFYGVHEVPLCVCTLDWENPIEKEEEDKL
jgi:hypothetical protein